MQCSTRLEQISIIVPLVDGLSSCYVSFEETCNVWTFQLCCSILHLEAPPGWMTRMRVYSSVVN